MCSNFRQKPKYYGPCLMSIAIKEIPTHICLLWYYGHFVCHIAPFSYSSPSSWLASSGLLPQLLQLWLNRTSDYVAVELLVGWGLGAGVNGPMSHWLCRSIHVCWDVGIWSFASDHSNVSAGDYCMPVKC